MQRRQFLVRVGLATAALVSRDLLEGAFASDPVAEAGDGPYGPLGPADSNGLQLPTGFTSRMVARTGDVVTGTEHTWHRAPDGGACFAAPNGGWVYVSNSEVGGGAGGVSALHFDAVGSVVAAYPILAATSRNCAGGPTPWGTWLSCEESGETGQVWECDPSQIGQGVARPLLGRFNHEAAAVDPSIGVVYLTEDARDGRLYRFIPGVPGDLTAGVLQAATVVGDLVTWSETSSSGPDRRPNTTAFDGGEGLWFGSGVVYMTTKGDGRVWELTPSNDHIRVLYDIGTSAPSALNAVDNVTVHAPSGDVFVAEDGGGMELCVLATVGRSLQVAPVVRITGQSGSEVTGPAFSPDGMRLYLSSQRGADGRGVTYEISGPFRTAPPPPSSIISPASCRQTCRAQRLVVSGS